MLLHVRYINQDDNEKGLSILIVAMYFLTVEFVVVMHIMSMAQWETAITPLLMHWSYYSLALSHRRVDINPAKRH